MTIAKFCFFPHVHLEKKCTRSDKHGHKRCEALGSAEKQASVTSRWRQRDPGWGRVAVGGLGRLAVVVAANQAWLTRRCSTPRWRGGGGGKGRGIEGGREGGMRRGRGEDLGCAPLAYPDDEWCCWCWQRRETGGERVSWRTVTAVRSLRARVSVCVCVKSRVI